ncbi:MAG: cysteine desulfurase family protein [Bacteroidia bacterium]
MRPVIYLDHNATTPVDAEVLEYMLPYFSVRFGNAASRTHSFGWTAADAVEKARLQIASLLGAEAQEIIFCSGSTEAINLGIKGVYENYQGKGKHIVTVTTEHKAVLDTCSELEKKGAEITRLPVDRQGMLDLELLSKAIRPDTILVCIMQANNETGLLHPVAEIAELVNEKGSLLFCDATQAAGKVQVDVKENRIAMLCLSAHKFYGPKGAGALYVSRKNPRVSLSAQMHGGGHERGLRSGTLNVPALVGFGKASELAMDRQWDDAMHLSRLRTLLEQAMLDLGNVFVNGNSRHRLPNTSCLAFSGIKASELIPLLPELAISTSSACTSALPEPSHVLKAMQVSDTLALASVRFSLGRENTEEEIRYVIGKVSDAVTALRKHS